MKPESAFKIRSLVQLFEILPEGAAPRDSTYYGPRKFVLRQERRGLGKILENIFTNKEDKDNKQEKDNKQDKNRPDKKNK